MSAGSRTKRIKSSLANSFARRGFVRIITYPRLCNYAERRLKVIPKFLYCIFSALLLLLKTAVRNWFAADNFELKGFGFRTLKSNIIKIMENVHHG